MATNEYDIAQGTIGRQRGLIDALTQQSLTPSKGQMVGQVYVGPSLLDALSKPLMALAANYAGGNLDKEELANSQARQGALVEALSGLQNQPGSPGFTTEALGSQFPELQKAGMANLAAQLSPRAQESYTAPTMDASGNLVQFSNRGSVKNTGIQGYVKPDNQLKIVQNADGTQSYASIDANTGASKVIPGEAYVRPAAQTNINNNMPKQEGQFGKTLGQKDAERYDASNTVLQNEAKTQATIGRLQALENEPMFRGGAAPLINKLTSIASTFGLNPTPEESANAEKLQALVESSIVDLIKEGGRGITDEDARRQANTMANQMLTPGGAVKVREQMSNISNQNVRQAKAVQGYLRNRYPDAFPASSGQQSAPQAGDVMDGYQFQGGDPSDPGSWRKAP